MMSELLVDDRNRSHHAALDAVAASQLSALERARTGPSTIDRIRAVVGDALVSWGRRVQPESPAATSNCS